MSKFPNSRLENCALWARRGARKNAEENGGEEKTASMLVSPYSVKGFAGVVVAGFRRAAQ